MFYVVSRCHLLQHSCLQPYSTPKSTVDFKSSRTGLPRLMSLLNPEERPTQQACNSVMRWGRYSPALSYWLITPYSVRSWRRR